MLDMLVGDICYRISTLYCTETLPKTPFPLFPSAAAAAKSLQSCPTLCNPIDGSPPGSPVPGILQARTLEGVAISFSNAWKWKVKVKSLSRVRLLATPWTAAHQAPPTTGFSRHSAGVGCLCLLRLRPSYSAAKHAQTSQILSHTSTFMAFLCSPHPCFLLCKLISLASVSFS